MTGAAVTLGLSSLALAAFPLVRPFFPFDPTTPAETLAGASRAVTSPQWLVAHYLALIGSCSRTAPKPITLLFLSLRDSSCWGSAVPHAAVQASAARLRPALCPVRAALGS